MHFGFAYLVLLVVPLVILQRLLHREIQAIFLMITRRADISITLFSLLFLPGVLLHESSHFLMARILGVRTGRFSILPRPLPDGRLQLGFVETAPSDMIRDTLIGAAPLLAGGAFILYAALIRLNLYNLAPAIFSQGPENLISQLRLLQASSDFWLWFYLIFTVSSTMMPSASDRRSWLKAGAFIVALFILIGVIIGFAWIQQNLYPIFDRVSLVLAVIAGVSDAAHLILYIPLLILRVLISRLTGLQVQ